VPIRLVLWPLDDDDDDDDKDEDEDDESTTVAEAAVELFVLIFMRPI
jgi:hypothetical protein